MTRALSPIQFGQPGRYGSHAACVAVMPALADPTSNNPYGGAYRPDLLVASAAGQMAACDSNSAIAAGRVGGGQQCYLHCDEVRGMDVSSTGAVVAHPLAEAADSTSPLATTEQPLCSL